ncbi:DUF86 domain-containing protein [Paenalkalicoccus suaedae]|uniref:DUF86 domain-containing protein n=1 Tax=Paenalkalicoccus suaedae TaxID=2592382 RepID=A0A859FH83_9BACI|nr:DUF86 domain-containing protein [Paenalkalicoccus suaedae]QKS72188.1 DUF86 domain-containing protein [Paenalkalicoccus suaedae]
MYFVDRSLIEARLRYLEELTEHFPQVKEATDKISILALERIGHMIIETMMDVGNQMIDGFIMRDPGSFEDIVHIMIDERVVTKEEGEAIERLLPYRKELLQNYTGYDVEALKKGFEQELSTIQVFPERIRTYLVNELGPVSAFIPQKEDKS